MTETELDRNIRRLCRDLGLRCYHTHDSRRSPAGFPDLVIVGPNGVIYAELKTTTGKLRPEQTGWRDDLIAAGQTWHLWRPDGLADGTIARTLTSISTSRRATTMTARCTGDRACPQRWATGPDRDCGQHASSDGNVFAAAEAMGIDLPPDSRGRTEGD